ncbi:hypothetical protein ACFL23_00275 [Patescibacteria group bacterium]
MQKKIFISLISLFLISSFCYGLVYSTSLIHTAQASMFDEIKEGGLEDIGYTVYGSETPQKSVTQIIAEIIKYILSFLGIIFLVLTLYGGFLWMTAGGNEEQVTRAKSIITNGIIGVIIIISSYAITYFVLENLIRATTGIS